jgi:hypothetical protein
MTDISAETHGGALSGSNRLAVLAACIQQEHAACASALQRGLGTPSRLVNC